MKPLKQTFLLVLLLSSATLFAACGSSDTSETDSDSDTANVTTDSGEIGEEREVEGGAYDRVSVEELRSIKEDDNVVLVNTHIPFEGDIPGADISVPYDEIEANLDQLPEDEDTKVVLYCMTGPMSAEAAEVLVERGYENVLELDGGMRAWQDAGFPLEGG